MQLTSTLTNVQLTLTLTNIQLLYITYDIHGSFPYFLYRLGSQSVLPF